ncbi:hypothetical protein [Polluticoccus soli]|uniref:hypothetical protein n=1 Tax=Polluticoccus soli TaxID=3034150 RepID=UPI0023E2A0C7|nr:hypothetical protein [Flavipsychrobacter sp. JY13-12]
MSGLLLCIGLLVIYPYYQYFVDPDATAYLTISRRYAADDFARAVNGYWSPWSCWLTALGIKTGLAAFPAAIIANALGALCFLFVSHSLFILFAIERRLQWALNSALAGFLLYATFKQTFDDLWECVFLLTSLRVMLSAGYLHRPRLWVLNGVIGVLAYFAKAYAFPFFILNTVCCSYFLSRLEDEKGNGWIKASVFPVVVMIVCSSWWIYLLYNKYGIITTSTAGTLNTSWYLVGHPLWADGIKALVPPIYHDSPYYWEDPYLVNGDTPHFWNGLRLFLLQIVKAGFNLLKMVKSMGEISAFMLATWILAWGVLFASRLRMVFDRKLRVLTLSFLLFPLGFVLINFEARYIWYMLPLSMVLGALAIQRFRENMGGYAKIVAAVFALSYLVWPIWDMKGMANEGRTEHQTAKKLKALNVNGSFTANVVYGPQMPAVARLAYFSGCRYYNMPHSDVPKQQLLQEMRRYRVKYYFHYQPNIDGNDFQFRDEAGVPFPEVSQGRLSGLKVFLVNP